MLAAIEVRETFDDFLQRDLQKELLRFTTAGSVDDGKSTLIGRLLHDTKGIYEDQLASLKKNRINRSTGPIDFSLLTDGLRAEREQGITIDVAYRYFQTAKRKFIIADTPGHEQYTRNMATGASTAHLAVILIDATKGLLPQTRRHTYIASLLGIPNILAAINKIDLLGYSEDVFLRLQDDFLRLAEQLKISAVQCIPVSALEGDNVVMRSVNTLWFSGPTFLDHLETVSIRQSSEPSEVRFPVQYVIRPDASFRGFAGQIASGAIRAGDTLLALPSRQVTRVESIVTFDGELATAGRAQSVTLKLEDEIDLSRGDMLVSPENLPAVSRHFAASLVWLHEKPLHLGATYLLKHTTRQVKAKVVELKHRVDVNSFETRAASELEMNGIAFVEIEAISPLFFDSYEQSRATGSFILIDILSNATVGAGMIRNSSKLSRLEQSADREEEQSARQVAVAPQERFDRHGHLPGIFFLSAREGLTSAAERALFEAGFETVVFRPDSVASSAIPALVSAMWSHGVLILLVGDDISPDIRSSVEFIGADSVFDLSASNSQLGLNDLLAEIVAHAESLRIRRPKNHLKRTD
jgi:sulfate adenylyltransferase large subunit